MTDDELETLIAAALQRDAEALMREIVLPPRDLVVWKARLYARRREVQRASRAIDRVIAGGPALTLVSAVAFGVTSGSFGRIAAMPLAVPLVFLGAAILATAPYGLWKIGGLE